MTEEPRCPNCGALVSADAEWCGQCYTRLRTEPVRAETSAVAPVMGTTAPSAETLSRAIEVEGGRLAWTCPVCETRNAIEVSWCATCGTPFSRLLAEPEQRPEIDPQTAAVWSMVFPGLGHWKLGRRTDAVARFAMFGWSFGALMVLIVSRFGKGGLGPTLPLFVLFATASVVIYVLSVLDAYRIAAGDEPVVSSRVLLWASAGLVFLSVLIATFVTLPSARR